MGIPIVAYELQEPENNGSDRFGESFERDERHERRLPMMYCPQCRRPFNPDPIPQAETLAPDHPFWRLLEQIEEKLTEGEAKTEKEAEMAWSILMQKADEADQRCQQEEWTPELSEDWSKAFQAYQDECFPSTRLNPEEFTSLARVLRESLALGPKHHILPHARLGLLPVRWRSPMVADFMWCVSFSVIVTQRAVDTFEKAGLTGWEVCPLRVTEVVGTFSSPLLYELLFMGDAGDPASESVSHEITECSRCGNVVREVPGGLSVTKWWYVNSDSWDGTDFFCFRDESRSSGYISQRAKQVIEMANLTNISFRPINEPRSFKIKGPPMMQ